MKKEIYKDIKIKKERKSKKDIKIKREIGRYV